MSDEEFPSLKPSRRVPAWVWLAILPGVLIGLNQVRKGGRERAELSGAGPLYLLKSEDALEALRYYPTTLAHAPISEARALIIEEILIQPSVFAFSLDLEAWAQDKDPVSDLEAIYTELHRRTQNAATMTVAVGPWLPDSAPLAKRIALEEVRQWWRSGPCQRAKRLVCVDLAELQGEAEMKAALQAGMQTALSRLKSIRATTQPGR